MKRNTRRILALSASLGLPALGAISSSVLAQTNGVWSPTGFTGANGSGIYSNPSNWAGGNVADGTGAIADFSQLNITANTTVTVDSAHNLGTLLFADTTPSNSWILTNSSSAGITLATSSGTPTISVVGLGVGNSYGAFLNLPVLGTQGFTKSGNGDLVLTGGVSNVISGNIYVTAGMLDTSHGADFKNISGSITVSSGAVFDANQGFDSNNFADSFILSGSGNTNQTPASGIVSGFNSGSTPFGALNLQGNATVSGGITLAGNATISHDFNYGYITGTITGAYNVSFNTLVTGQPDLYVNGAIQTTTGSVIVSATSATTTQGVTFAGTNNYTGNMIVLSGIARGTSANNFGGSSNSNNNSIQLSGGTLDLQNNGGTNFVHPVLLTASSVITPDRATLGSSTLTHTLGVLTAQGGTLTVAPGSFFNGGSGNLTFASTTVGAGASSFVANNSTGTGTPTTTLNLGLISRAPGSGTIDFPSTSTGKIVVGNTANALLGGYATYGGGTAFAQVNALGNVIAYTPTSQDDPSQWQSGQDISESAGFNSNTVAPASINSLRFISSTANTVNIGSTLSIATGGVLIAPGSGAKTISGGTLEGSASGDLIVLQNSTTAATINSVIANNGGATALTKSGVGTLVLTGTETYTGGTTIAAGNLQISSGLITGNVLNNGTLTFSQITNGTFAGNISGSGLVVKTNAGSTGNAGILTLTGNNSYSGGTNVNEGTVQFGSATALGTGLVSVSGQSGNTSFLDLNGFSPSNNFVISGDDYFWNSNTSTSVLSGGLTANSFARVGNPSDTAGSDNITINGVVSGASGVNKYGSGVIAFNNTSTYTSYTNITGGVLRANEGVGLPSTIPLMLAGGTIEMGTNFVRSLGTSGGTVSLSAGADGFSAYGAPITVSIGGLSTPTALVWGVTPNFNPTSLILNAASANNTLTLQNPIDFNGSNQTISVGAATAIANGVLSSATGTGGLIKTGAGTLVLTAANTYNGNTTISAGTLQMGNGGTTGVIPGNVTDNAALNFNRSDTTLTFSNSISGSGTVTQSGADTLVLSGGNSYMGQTNILAGELQSGSATALGNTTAAVVVSNGATLDQNGFPESSKPITIAGAGFTGLGALINSSATGNAQVGAVTLTGNATIGVESSSYNGRMDIGGGATCVNGSTYTLTKAGPGNLRINGGTFTVGAFNITAGTVSILANNNVLYAGLPVSVSSGATLFLYNSSDAANTNFATSSTLEDNTGTNSLSGTTTLSGSGKVNFNFDNNLTLNATGAFTGTGGLSINATSGNNFLLTNSNNNYSGGTLINSGTVTAGATGALSPNSAFQLYGGTLNDAAYNNSIASLLVNTGGTLDLGFGTPLTDLGTATFAGTLNISSGTVGTLPETLMTYTSHTGTFTTSLGVPATDTLLYTSTALEIIANGPATLTWNNTGGSGDGVTWNTTQVNWNNGSGAVAYSDTSNTTTGDNVSFTDVNNGHYNVSIPALVHPTSVTVNASGNYLFNGSGGIAGPTSLIKLGTGMLTLSSSNSYTGGTNVSVGTLVLGGANAYPANTALTLASGATVDVGKYTMAISNTSIGTIYQEVAAAYNKGAWNGTSGTIGVITSSAAAGDASHLTAVGEATGLTSFEGSTVPSTDVLVKYTYYGDANLSGTVDGSDYSLIDNGYLNGLTGWQNGDFNYDGVVNGSDYTLIDNAYNSQGVNIAAEVASPTAQIAGAGASSAVPEPASLGLLGIGVVGLLGRRGSRRRR